MTEDEYRAVLAWLKAFATDDIDGLDVLAQAVDLRQVANGLADLCVVLMGHFGDPIGHIDRMFRVANARSRGR